MVIQLPTFKGYTVDMRLRQFRKSDPAKQILEFVEWDSPKGRKLLAEYRNSLQSED